MDKSELYYGDNLDVMRRYIKDESIDLVYLDPPFNSNIDYNVLFAEPDRSRAASQIKAFKDTWHWDRSAALAFDDFVVSAPTRASQALQSFRSLVGEGDMLAYLAMMAPRLDELRRALKPTGSLYLHCDPTASHYLKLLMDATFGPGNFRNEIVWKRTSTHSTARRCGPVHDILLFYTKSANYTWNPQHDAHVADLRARHDLSRDAQGRLFRLSDLTGAGTRKGSSGQPWRGFSPTEIGRHWITTVEKLEELARRDLIHFPAAGKWPRMIRYQDESKGRAIGDVWDTIPPINAKAAERLGYPTQKPEALLERIIRASSREGDTVLDPFCGCGTAVAVAQRLGRRWVGIDITHLAVGLIKTRLRDAHGPTIAGAYTITGEPVDLAGARALAESDRYQFQYWALGLVGARPTPSDQKKGADKGIDGRLYFHDDAEGGEVRQAVFSVKSGKADVSHLRDLRGVLDRERAAIGVLLTMNDPTAPMRAEAAGAGFYPSPWGTKHPRLQIATVADLLAGAQLDLPPSRDLRTFKKAPKAKRPDPRRSLFPTEPDEPS